MSTPSASRAERPDPPERAERPDPVEHGVAEGRQRVWDAPVRVFHWTLVACFAGAWLTAESEAFRGVHLTLGYTLAGLVAFRVVWGFVGTRHARFADFVRGPAAVAADLRATLGGRPVPHVGHNPTGGWVVLGLLALAATVAGTGWLTLADRGGEAFEEVHEAVASAMLAVVAVHVAGVVAASRLHRENLVAAMLTGRKRGAPSDGIGNARRGVAATLLVAVLAFWTWQWIERPVAASGAESGAAARHGGRDADRDDD